jgi:enoyl-CoA hydratase/carnithine racemase
VSVYRPFLRVRCFHHLVHGRIVPAIKVLVITSQAKVFIMGATFHALLLTCITKERGEYATV